MPDEVTDVEVLSELVTVVELCDVVTVEVVLSDVV